MNDSWNFYVLVSDHQLLSNLCLKSVSENTENITQEDQTNSTAVSTESNNSSLELFRVGIIVLCAITFCFKFFIGLVIYRTNSNVKNGFMERSSFNSRRGTQHASKRVQRGSTLFHRPLQSLRNYIYILTIVELLDCLFYGAYKYIQIWSRFGFLLPSRWTMAMVGELLTLLQIIQCSLFITKRWWIAAISVFRSRILSNLSQTSRSPGRFEMSTFRCQRLLVVLIFLGNMIWQIFTFRKITPITLYYCPLSFDFEDEVPNKISSPVAYYSMSLSGPANRTTSLLLQLSNVFSLTISTLIPGVGITFSCILCWHAILMKGMNPYGRYRLALTLIALFLTTQLILEVPLMLLNGWLTFDASSLALGGKLMEPLELVSTTNGIVTGVLFLVGDQAMRETCLEMFRMNCMSVDGKNEGAEEISLENISHVKLTLKFENTQLLTRSNQSLQNLPDEAS